MRKVKKIYINIIKCKISKNYVTIPSNEKSTKKLINAINSKVPKSIQILELMSSK